MQNKAPIILLKKLYIVGSWRKKHIINSFIPNYLGFSIQIFLEFPLLACNSDLCF